MPDFDPGFLRYNDGHAYDGERCIHCGVNVYDAQDDQPCVDHEPLIHTSETADATTDAHTLGDDEPARWWEIWAGEPHPAYAAGLA